MAISVGSWDSLVNALQGAQTDDVINITADIDMNSIEPISSPVLMSVAQNVIINGNGHALLNMSNENLPNYNESIFKLQTGSSYIANNWNFLNMSLVNSHTPIFRGTGSNTLLTLNNSVIQGRTNYTLMDATVKLKNCMLTFNHCRAHLNSFSATAAARYEDCWIKFINCQATDTYAVWRNSKGCYFEGTYLPKSPSSANFFNGVEDCCININSNFNTPIDIDSKFVPTGSLINILNSTTFPAIAGSTSTTLNKIVTDAEMKNAQFLADLGFNIIA